MSQVTIRLTNEQKEKLFPIEKEIANLRGGSYAIFAQIHYPDGKAVVVLVSGDDCRTIRDLLKDAK